MQLNYRKQLIGLAKLYGIVEIKNYLKSSRRVTNAQIELLLIKNNIKLPKRSLSKSIFLNKSIILGAPPKKPTIINAAAKV